MTTEPVAATAAQLAPPGRIALAVAGLTGLAIGFPIARVLIGAPEFFIAHRSGPAATLAFWVAVTVGVPVLAGALAVVPLPGGRRLRAPIAALLGALAAAGALQPFSAWALPFWLGTVAGGVLAAKHLGRTRSFTDVLAVGSVGCLLLLAWAVGPSRIGSYVRSGNADAVLVSAADPAPVVIVVFDEFPLIALLGSDLRIDPERYPNFAALAATSDWYRLAASASPNTAYAVPALLSGTTPEPGTVSVASQYPTNVFLQLARTHEVHGFESVTALCPPSVCSDHAATVSSEGAGLWSDLSVVLRRALGTDDMRRGLPLVEGAWSDFDAGSIDDGSARKLVFDGSTFDRETDALLEVMAARPDGDRPLALVAHATAPHAPWVALPGGGRYPVTDPIGSQPVDGFLHWTGDDAERRAGYQRMLLQIGALDEVLGKARAELEASGTWDDAVVVVTADHGSQFEEGYWRDARRGGVEVTGVPLFIKRPQQTKGRIDDRAVISTDVLPTVLDLADVRTPSDFDGIDVVRDEVPARRTEAFVPQDSDPLTPEQSLDALREVVERRARWIDPDGGWDAVYQPGVPSPVVGRSDRDLGTAEGVGGSWSRAAGQTGRQLTVTLDGGSAAHDGPIVVSCRGVAVAALPQDAFLDEVATAYLASECPDADVALGVLTPSGVLGLTRTP